MSDDKVIPFPGRVTWANLGPPADPEMRSTAELLDGIEARHFEGEGGPLTDCVEWIELRRRLQ
jgi:hypothetical protein